MARNRVVAAYLQRGYVIAKPIGAGSLYCDLYGATHESHANQAYLSDFIDKVRTANQSINAELHYRQ